MSATPDPAELVADLIARARRAGAESADAIHVHSAALSLHRRLGKPEKLERAESADLGLRVFVGKRQAIVSSTDNAPRALAELVERAMAMVAAVPEDPYCGLADPSELARGPTAELDLVDASEPPVDELTERARRVEETALAVNGVTNSEGAEAGWSRSAVTLAATNGFAGSYARTGHSLSVAVIAGTGTGMETDYDYTSAVHAGDMEPAETIGRRAGNRAVRRLNPRKVATQQVPVIYDPRVARGLVGHLAGAISGPAIARRTSFLKDMLGKAVFSDAINIVDDPHRRRGLRSKPFDGEGIANARRAVIEKGVLKTWLLDLASARQLGLKSTGHASRGTGGPPGPAATNLYMEPGKLAPDALMSDIKSGFYVTGLMGMGVNNVTGDYSQGANGFWIENGQLTYPVSELTIASNLKSMYQTIVAANDLTLRYGVDAPTLRIEGMTVAGR
ncbi:MAG: TldD/PmbA family protein [Alphaproteobacteria bacterium]|nr:TldD/PmbA family protein [Alphaproteobacteria bacterium]